MDDNRHRAELEGQADRELVVGHHTPEPLGHDRSHTMSIRADSTEYRTASVTTSHDLTGVPIQVALPKTGQPPETWYDATTLSVSEANGKWTSKYRILIGPDGGDVTLEAGTYDWTIRVQDNPETPVLMVGKFTVTAI